jgi:preprotein translocase subunit YajC
MFASPAYAASAAGQSGSATVGLLGILPWVAIFVIFYFLLIRPQQRRAKMHQQMIAAVKKNDTVVTGGGIVGKVTKVEDNEVEVEIASGVRIKVVKGTLAEVRPHGAKPAND